MIMQNPCFRAGSKVLIGMTHHQVEAPHGLKNNILMGPLEGTGIAIKDQVIGTEEILLFVKMILMLKPFSVLPLVGIDSSIGPSSMRKILSGGGLNAFLILRNHGAGDIETKMIMTLHLSLIV